MSGRREFRDLAPREEVHDLLAELVPDPGVERVTLGDARGRVLAERVDAGIDVPGFDRASVDGYAVRARDTFGADEADPVALPLVGVVHAGERPDATVAPGTAVEVSTGAVLPDGADAVVMVERTTERDRAAGERGDASVGGSASEGGDPAVGVDVDVDADADADVDVEVRTAVAPGDGVTVAGADIAAGTRALGPGTDVGPREVALLSALGVDEVRVRARPTVAILSTGDELVPPGDPLDHRAGQVYDVNGHTLASAVAEAGGEPRRFPRVADDADAMAAALREAAADCDVVLTSGSTSASTVDVIYRVIEEAGTLHRHGVAVKPGKPMLVGEIDATPYVGLPGFPVSALTIFRRFVAPLVREAAGRRAPRTGTLAGRMAVRERYAEGRHRLLPVGLVRDGDGELLVYPADRGSGATTSLVYADGIVDVPADTAYLDAGERVDVQLFSPSVRVPDPLSVGADDPLFAAALDRLPAAVDARHLPVGTREGLRRLRDGVPDVAVVAGPDAAGDASGDAGRGVADAATLARWEREWGLAVAADVADRVAGLGDLLDAARDGDADANADADAGGDRALRVATVRRGTGLRASLDAALDALADQRGLDAATVRERVVGDAVATRAHGSPPRRVRDGRADVGVCLRASLDGLADSPRFVPLGTQPARALAAADRRAKPGVEALADALADGDATLPSGVRLVED